MYCAHINIDAIRPGKYLLKCGKCDRKVFFGDVFHVQAAPSSQIPKDAVIPTWADEEYPFDTIPDKLWASFPPAFFDPAHKVKQRGRVHVIMISEGIYRS